MVVKTVACLLIAAANTEVPVTEVYVTPDKPSGMVHYTDPLAAERLELHKMHVPSSRGGFATEKDGLNFVENLWRGFVGNTYIYCEPAVDGHVFISSRPTRNGSRREPEL